MRKPMKVSRRAMIYANRSSAIRLSDRADGVSYTDAALSQGWADGYRAAMRDVRKQLNANKYPDEMLSAVGKLVDDTERLK